MGRFVFNPLGLKYNQVIHYIFFLPYVAAKKDAITTLNAG